MFRTTRRAASVLAAASLMSVAGSAMAIEYTGMTAVKVAEYSLNDLGGIHPNAVQPGAVYSNVTSFLGNVVLNGGSAGGITRMVMDDITPAGGVPGQSITRLTFSVVNLDPGDPTDPTIGQISARPRLRFWNANGAGGNPGLYYSNTAVPANNVGFTFNPITFNPNSVSTFFTTFTTGQFLLPSGTFWAGETFDNVGSTTGAGDAELNELGQGVFNPPDVGSSANSIFTTTAAGSFFGTNSPAGAQTNFGGTPVANLGWEFVQAIPEPTTASLIGVALVGLATRRRK